MIRFLLDILIAIRDAIDNIFWLFGKIVIYAIALSVILVGFALCRRLGEWIGNLFRSADGTLL